MTAAPPSERAIRITAALSLDPRELVESFVRASGPGGQNVYKVASAVQLRFDVRGSPSLPEPVKARLMRLAGKRLTGEGVIVIAAERFRTQAQNRRDARGRLIALIVRAAAPPRPRRPTRPPATAKRERREGKARRAAVKRLRKAPREE